jgi:enamine deaminase RidA (YjgF/YER057c/UK114 family)
MTIYVVGNIDSLSEAWQAVKQYFNGIVPPATLLGVALLGHENQLVEIDATIIKK